MEDFLKDRPTIDPKSALVLAAEPKPAISTIKPQATPAGAAPAGGSPPSAFGDLRRGSAAPVAAGKPGVPRQAGSADVSLAAPAASQDLKGEHGTRVQTIVEFGRVTKIIVTCTCGKVTEIACQY